MPIDGEVDSILTLFKGLFDVRLGYRSLDISEILDFHN
jgi:hypothetical protein